MNTWELPHRADDLRRLAPTEWEEFLKALAWEADEAKTRMLQAIGSERIINLQGEAKALDRLLTTLRLAHETVQKINMSKQNG